MSDRVSASITIGGHPLADRLGTLVEAIQSEGLSTEWDSAPFDPGELP